ncbi:MAG: serine/threonine-protein kinase [Chloroflexota bacterium]|nr:serine/threonine-protein kinase [Chloroflexota bacterium]
MQTILNDRYNLHERLGEGGMATVYRATQTNLDRPVAIKFIKTEHISAQFRTRFEREAKAIAGLNHPNITQVYDYDHDSDERPYMVMELLSGDDLGTFLTKNVPLRLGDVLTIMAGVALALDYAHARGIIHRDIKPSNIFITHDRQVKLMDFGLVRQMNDTSDLSMNGSLVIGTPRYFSPEQAGSKAVDHRSDLYGLGVIFYEMLTGTMPYTGSTPLDLAVQHLTTPVPDVLALRPDLPALTGIIVYKLLAKDPDDRYPNAGALLADLDLLEQSIKRETSLSLLPRLDVSQAIVNPPAYTLLNGGVSDSKAATSLHPAGQSSALSSTLLQRKVVLPIPFWRSD